MIILYNPPSSAGRKPVLPMSLLSLGALLEGEQDYTIVDGNLASDTLATVDRAIRDTRATTLGVTVMPGPQLADAVTVCREIKRRHPRTAIVWGGYFPTQHAETCLQAGFVDGVVRGHGEHAFRDLVAALDRGENPAAIPGVSWRVSTDDIVSNGLAPIPHPNQLSLYPYHRVEMSRYVRRTFMGQRTLSHQSSYGCPFLCNFCAVVNMVNGRWLAESGERTALVVRKLVREYGANAVEFYDNNFFVDEKRVRELAELIDPLEIGWWGEGRIDTMLKFSDQTWRALRRSGLRMVYLGAESGSDETLRRMDKGGTLSTAKTLELAKKMKEVDIVPEFSFVVGSPPDPARDLEETIAFIRRVKGINEDAEVVLYLYTPVPLAGDLYDQARAVGFRFPETLDEWVSPQWQDFAQRRSGNLAWVNAEICRQLHDFERTLHAFYPTVTDPRLKGLRRVLPRWLSAWRYYLGIYGHPIELRALHRLFPYQRPETSGF